MRKTIFSTSLQLVLLCFFCLANNRCSNKKPAHHPVAAFYHWQTALQLTGKERAYLDSLGVQKLYAKFFDVDWDGATAQPVPLAVVEIDTANLNGLEIVPTVFITNRSLLQLPMQKVDSLADRILRKIVSLSQKPPTELQFDCDWTAQTEAKFFALLERFKEKMPGTTLSATVRLHQYRYFEKTGVPPVDRGMLMCYNMGDLETWETENSILDPAAALPYLQGEDKYPLPLDVALPIFQWGVLFRDGQMIRLLNNLSEADLQDTARFKKNAPSRFEVVKSTYLQAHYLYAGDQLRLEAISPKALNKMAELLNRVQIGPKPTVAFYHLDTAAIYRFPVEKVRKVLNQF